MVQDKAWYRVITKRITRSLHMILEIKKQIKITNIWQNTKFSDLLSKIHYQSEHKIHLYYIMAYILFDNGFWKVNPKI